MKRPKEHVMPSTMPVECSIMLSDYMAGKKKTLMDMGLTDEAAMLKIAKDEPDKYLAWQQG
jgi:hypothetical protein